jgi:hypothetical protein
MDTFVTATTIPKNLRLVMELTDEIFIPLHGLFSKVREDLIPLNISLRKVKENSRNTVPELEYLFDRNAFVFNRLRARASKYLGRGERFVYHPEEGKAGAVLMRRFYLGEHQVRDRSKKLFLGFYHSSFWPFARAFAVMDKPDFSLIVFGANSLIDFLNESEPIASADLYSTVAHEILHTYKNMNAYFGKLKYSREKNEYFKRPGEIIAHAFGTAAAMFYMDNLRRKSENFKPSGLTDFAPKFYTGCEVSSKMANLFERLTQRYRNYFALAHEDSQLKIVPVMRRLQIPSLEQHQESEQYKFHFIK